ncbi:MAG: peptidoglycan editing factor PgeF [Hormoscilla sp. SP5CHS1]|nr:peptidoglycan editing factor PgeF [Hormoscilla sp. SP12CHS1]MBC6456072.1 peptidoglycan editing factor PgeF [Hormoscilla sp. SP5CHS1]
MNSWHWQTGSGLSYLTCSLLSPWSHGFFTRQFFPRPPVELVQVLQPTAAVYQAKQVHGNVVVTPAEFTNQSLPEADGVMTATHNQSVWVCSADCVPVLIADAHTGQVAAVHAGWRGTAAEIISRAIARMLARGSQLSDLYFAIGPAISGPVYQVSVEVAAQVGATIAPNGDDNAILEYLFALPDSPLFPDPEPGRVRLDVPRVNAIQLQQLGVQGSQVAIAPHCTYQEPEHFFSYRRKDIKKVQWSGIVSSSRGR